MRHFDVAIVGSGPAGASSAYFLRGSGLSVVVIERLSPEGYARYHNVCAAGMSARTGKILPIEDKYILNRINTIRVTVPDGNAVTVKMKGYVIDRPGLFSSLLQSSGATIIGGSVVDVKEGYVLTLSDGSKIGCSSIIGADGAFSIVRKKLFGSEPKRKIPVTEFVVEDGCRGELEFAIDERFHGAYSWRFPRGDNSCTGGVTGTYYETDHLSKGARYIPIGGVGKIVSGNAYLVGDAAAMANPVSFGGLSVAIRSAKKAVSSIVSKRPGSYQKWWDGSRMSDRRFMELHEKLSEMDNGQLMSMCRHFTHGNVYLDGVKACLRDPSNINTYFACLFAFIDGW